MPELSQALFRVMRRLDGARFNGHLTASTVGTTRDKAPYRVLVVRKPCFLVAGDTVFVNDNEVVILMEQPDDFPWGRSFKAAYAQQVMAWARSNTTTDPVSKVQKTSSETSLGNLYVNFDSAEEMNVQGFQDTKYRFITGQAIQVGDKVGTYIVKRVVESLGVKLAFVA